MKLTVREARESDHEALCPLWAQGDGLHARLQPDFFRVTRGLPRSHCHLSDVVAASEETLLAAEIVAHQPRLVGFVHVTVFDTPPHPLKVQLRRGHVEEMVVEQEYRRQGVGRALMEAAARWCRDRGAAQLLLTVWGGNEPAEAFYDRLGYRPVSHVLGRQLGPAR